MTSNLERWRYWMKDVTSPDSFIDMGFYYMVSSFLQRRVWVGHEMSALFPNQYIILVAEPGIGKGLVIKQLLEIFKLFPLKSEEGDKSDKDRAIDALSEMIAHGGIASSSKEIILQVPVAANTTTFEQLIKALAESMRRIKCEKSKMSPSGIYFHKSLTFCLEEISSLLQKNTNKVVNLLITAFDCGDYSYETKTQGKDHLRKICVNFLGGTTPSFVRETFDSKLIDEGFASRTIFVYEIANRMNRFEIPEFTQDQFNERKLIIEHLGKLVELYGRVTYSPEAFEYLKHYFEQVFPNQRVNEHPKLKAYYARKNIHIQKMAMAVHFADSLDLIVSLADCEKAMTILNSLEKRMHYALSFGKNPLAIISKDIVAFIRQNGPKTQGELWGYFEEFLREAEMEECMRFLTSSGRLTFTNARYRLPSSIEESPETSSCSRVSSLRKKDSAGSPHPLLESASEIHDTESVDQESQET